MEWQIVVDLERFLGKKMKKNNKRKTEDTEKEESDEKITGMILIQHTHHSSLAKRIRECLQELEDI